MALLTKTYSMAFSTICISARLSASCATLSVRTKPSSASSETDSTHNNKNILTIKNRNKNNNDSYNSNNWFQGFDSLCCRSPYSKLLFNINYLWRVTRGPAMATSPSLPALDIQQSSQDGRANPW